MDIKYRRKLKIGDVVYLETNPDMIMIVEGFTLFRRYVICTRVLDNGQVGNFTIKPSILKFRKGANLICK